MPENLNPEHQLEYLKELRAKYEEALSNAQKSGDYSEATKLKDELEQRLSALEAQFPKTEIKKESSEYEINPENNFEETLFEELEKYNAYGVKDAVILNSLACFNNDRSMDFRKKLENREDCYLERFQSYAGVDNEASWQFREKFDIKEDAHFLLISLAGLDSVRAWDMRSSIFGANIENSNIDRFIAASLVGLDSPEAWDFRKDIWRRNGPRSVAVNNVLEGLAGINTPTAWEMRTLSYDSNIQHLPYLLRSLTGIDTDSAWHYRELAQSQLVQTSNMFPDEHIVESSLAKSLAGLDSKRAWNIRDKWIGDGKFYQVAKSLAGLNSPRAWGNRGLIWREYKKEVLSDEEVVSSLNGDFITAIGWRTARKYNKERDI